MPLQLQPILRLNDNSINSLTNSSHSIPDYGKCAELMKRFSEDIFLEQLTGKIHVLLLIGGEYYCKFMV